MRHRLDLARFYGCNLTGSPRSGGRIPRTPPFPLSIRGTLMQARTYLVLAAIVLMPCALLSVMFWNRPDFMISSDSLLPAEFVWDVLHHGYAWSGFQQARVPSFFPDLLIYGAVQVATGNWRVAIAVWVFVVLASLVAIASWITAQIVRSTGEAATLAVLLLVVAVLASAAFGFPPFATATYHDVGLFPYLFILLPFTHGGPFLIALAAAAVGSRAVVQGTPAKAIGLALVSFAAGMSDILWFTSFIAPFTAAAAGLLVGSVTKRTAIRLLSGVWVGGVLGWACAQRLDREPLPFSVLRTIPTHIVRFLTALGQQPGMMVVVVGLGLALATDVWRRGPRGWLASFWSVFAATSALTSLALAALLYEDNGAYRYALPFLWWTVILAAVALVRISGRHRMLLRLSVAAITAGLATVDLASGWHVPKLLVWESPLASCLQTAGLRAGLADYWAARETNAASSWQLQVEQIDANGAARVWGNDRLWYIHDIHDGSRRPPYRFVIMDGLLTDRIAAAYGQPDRVMRCGPTNVWIYDDADGLYRSLVRASPSMAATFASAPAQ